MPTLTVERANLCTFTFASARRCRMPLSPEHSYLCTFHARKEARQRAAEKAGQDIAFALSDDYISNRDLSTALAHSISAVAQRHMTPRVASTIAYLSQTLCQSIHHAGEDYIRTFGFDAWRHRISDNASTAHADQEDESSTAAVPTDGHESGSDPGTAQST
jgi:hypothetical protein